LRKRNSENVLGNVYVSSKVASVMRQKEMSCLVPVSATDLIWLEAIGMSNVDQGDDNDADMVTR